MEGRGAGAVAPSVAEEEVEEEAVDSTAGGDPGCGLARIHSRVAQRVQEGEEGTEVEEESRGGVGARVRVANSTCESNGVVMKVVRGGRTDTHTHNAGQKRAGGRNRSAVVRGGRTTTHTQHGAQEEEEEIRNGSVVGSTTKRGTLAAPSREGKTFDSEGGD